MGDNGDSQPCSHLPACIVAGQLKILGIINFYLVFLQILMRLWSKLPCFVFSFFISRKRFSNGEILKHIFFRNLGIAKVVAVDRDVKPPKYEFCKG